MRIAAAGYSSSLRAGQPASRSSRLEKVHPDFLRVS